MSNKNEVPCHNCITLPICINTYRKGGVPILYVKCSIVRSYIIDNNNNKFLKPNAAYIRVEKYFTVLNNNKKVNITNLFKP